MNIADHMRLIRVTADKQLEEVWERDWREPGKVLEIQDARCVLQVDLARFCEQRLPSYLEPKVEEKPT